MVYGNGMVLSKGRKREGQQKQNAGLEKEGAEEAERQVAALG